MYTSQVTMPCGLSLSQTKKLRFIQYFAVVSNKYFFLFLFILVYFMMAVNHLLVIDFVNNLFAPNIFVIILSHLF